MTLLALRLAQRRLEARMVDRVRFTRDTQGTGDDVFDPVTGALTPPGSDSATVYDGPALITRVANVARVVVQGSVDEARERYQVSIPADAPEVKVGDVGVATWSTDARLVGKAMSVLSVAYGTNVARQRCVCELSTPGPRT